MIASLFRNLRLARVGVSWRDRVLVFLLGLHAGLGERRRLGRRLLPALMRMMCRGKLLRVSVTFGDRVGHLAMRADNRADLLVGGEFAHGTYVGPSFIPDRIIDAGANIGAFSVLAMVHFPEAKLTCYEPDAENLKVLRHNLELNGIRADVRACGIWSKEVTLYFHAQSSYNGYISEEPSDCPIPCEVPDVSGRCWFKLDVEGAEYEVIPAMVAMGLRPPCITMELHHARERGGALVRVLREAGYAALGLPDEMRDFANPSFYLAGEDVGGARMLAPAPPADAERLRIVVRGWYGRENVGDDLLLIEVLRRIPERHDVWIVGGHRELRRLVPPGRRFRAVPEFETKWGALRLLPFADGLVYGGGGLFPCVDDGPGVYLAPVLAGLIGKPLFMLGLGINPKKDGWELSVWRFLRRRATDLTVRDPESAGFLERCDPKAGPARMLYDLYLASGGPTEQPRLAGLSGRYAVVCVASPFSEATVAASKDALRRHEALAEEFAGAVRELMGSGCEPVFVPFFPPTDPFLIAEVARRAGIAEARVVQPARDVAVRDLVNVFAGAEFCVCMRFHSLVLALRARRNFVCVAYDYKLECLAQATGAAGRVVRYGMSREVCFGEEFDLPRGELARRVREALPQREETEQLLRARMPEIEAVAKGNFVRWNDWLGNAAAGAPSGSKMA